MLYFVICLTFVRFMFNSSLSLSLICRPAAGYLYATLANTVITLMSMFGIVVLLCTSCTDVFQWSIQFCISLAVGSLTGDALLHLLPMVSSLKRFCYILQNPSLINYTTFLCGMYSCTHAASVSSF